MILLLMLKFMLNVDAEGTILMTPLVMISDMMYLLGSSSRQIELATLIQPDSLVA